VTEVMAECVRDVKFFSLRLFVSLSTRRDSGGEGGGGGKTARSEWGLCLTKYVWGKLDFIFISVKIFSKMLIMAKNSVKA
jgi:hypothetical protein